MTGSLPVVIASDQDTTSERAARHSQDIQRVEATDAASAVLARRSSCERISLEDRRGRSGRGMAR